MRNRCLAEQKFHCAAKFVIWLPLNRDMHFINSIYLTSVILEITLLDQIASLYYVFMGPDDLHFFLFLRRTYHQVCLYMPQHW